MKTRRLTWLSIDKNKAITVIVMAMVLLSVFMPFNPRTRGVISVTAQETRIPITVTDNSGNDLYNYTIEINLNSTNFNHWDIVSSDSIAFFDSNNNPLYYWIEYFNKTEENATIWVKIPYIPANGSTTIYMYYDVNGYNKYNDPHKAFAWYDNFTSDTSQYYNWDSGTWTWNTSTGILEGTGLSRSAPHSALYIKPEIFATLNMSNYRIISKMRSYKDGSLSNDGVVFRYKDKSSGIGFWSVWFCYSNENGAYHETYKRISLFSYNGIQNKVNILVGSYFWNRHWHIYDVRVYGSTVSAVVTDVEANRILSVSYTGITYDNGTVGVLGYDDIVYVDYFIVMKYVDPEPTVSIGSDEPVVEKEKIIDIHENSGNDLYNYTVRIDMRCFNDWNSTNDDGSDIYFTDNQGNPLYYWIEYYNKTEENATIWVKIPYIPANGDVEIYMHYGGVNKYPDHNSPGNVFLFYDDFNTDTGWTLFGVNGGKNYEITDSMLHLPRLSSNVGGADEGVYHSIQVGLSSGSYVFGMRMKIIKSGTQRGLTGFALSRDDPPTGDYITVGGLDSGGFGLADWGFDNDGVNEKISFTADYSGFHEWELVKNGNTYKLYYDGIYKGEYTATNQPTDYLVFEVPYSNNELYVDWVLVRPYVDPEPSMCMSDVPVTTTVTETTTVTSTFNNTVTETTTETQTVTNTITETATVTNTQTVTETVTNTSTVTQTVNNTVTETSTTTTTATVTTTVGGSNQTVTTTVTETTTTTVANVTSTVTVATGGGVSFRKMFFNEANTMFLDGVMSTALTLVGIISIILLNKRIGSRLFLVISVVITGLSLILLSSRGVVADYVYNDNGTIMYHYTSNSYAYLYTIPFMLGLLMITLHILESIGYSIRRLMR